MVARAAARRGDEAEALSCIEALLPWLERAPAWTCLFPAIAAAAAETLWLLERSDHAEAIERALRDKVITPDFRYPATSGHLPLARLCALSARHDEAVRWFAEGRRVLAEARARPVLAICDHDEALMYARRAGPGDTERARPCSKRRRPGSRRWV